jgi:putative polyketide hydroxylase
MTSGYRPADARIMTGNRHVLSTSVLIVGGGPAGLMTALLLARQGVRSLLAERRPGTSILPRATGLNVRTMEILRGLGLEPALRAAEVDVRGLPVMTELETLSGPVLHLAANLNSPGPEDAGWPSPTRQSFCAQDVLEPVLVDAIRDSTRADLRFNTELVGFDQDGSGVSAQLRDRTSGAVRAVRASYLVAADGAHSEVRNALGIPMTGHDDMSDELNVLFQANLSAALAGKRSIIFRVRNTWLPAGGILRCNDGANLWSLITRDPGDVTPARLIDIIRGCAGDPGLRVAILATGRWVKAAMLADRFQAGRVFLVGDAAHQLAPAGAMGMNTAIQGAHNLAWKLAGVIRGWAGQSVLETYEAERRPVSGIAVELSYRNEIEGNHARPILGLMLGAWYDSPAVVPDGTAAPQSPDPVAVYVPTARPGHRAPHHWLAVAGRRLSTIDLVDGQRFTVLTTSPAWSRSALEVAASAGVPVAAPVIDDAEWHSAYGIQPGGAVLVRPDGYVAARWHQERADPSGELMGALAAILSRHVPALPPARLAPGSLARTAACPVVICDRTQEVSHAVMPRTRVHNMNIFLDG